MTEDFLNGLLIPIATGFNNIGNAIQFVIDKLNEVGGLANIARTIGVGALGQLGVPQLQGVPIGGALNSQPMSGDMTTNNVTINNGGNTISGVGSMAGFEAGVQRSVRDALRR